MFLIGLGLQLCQLAGNKVPFERRILVASSQRDVLGEAIVAPSSPFTLLSLSDLPILLAFRPSSLSHPFLTFPCCCLVLSSSGGGRSSFGLLLGCPVGRKAIPESRAPGGSRRLLGLCCKWTENLDKAVGALNFETTDEDFRF